MSQRHALSLMVLISVMAAPATADVLLDGNQHIGDDDTAGDSSSDLRPTDPVTRAQILANPSNFHLSQTTTLTQLRLNDAIGLDGQVKLVINGSDVPLQNCGPCNSCTGRQVCGTLTLDLSTPLVLSAGFHTLAIDPISASNDIGFSSITLVSAQANASVNLNRRRHPGRPADPNNDNDANDNYDITDTGSPYYPDMAEGTSLSIPFTLAANRRLSEIRFYRLRDVDSNNSQVLVDGQLVGNLLNTGDPLETSPTIITTNLLLLAGAHTLRVDSAVLSGSDFDGFSWDDVLLLFTDVTTAGTPGFFNAVDDGLSALDWVTTKVAGGAFALDLYALSGLGTGVDASYNGTANVFLLNAADNSGAQDIYGCRSSWEPPAQALGAVTFASGQATRSGVFLDAGLREARIRITDTVTGASGCSIDNFAVRPATFGAISASHDSETTAGTAALLDSGGTAGLPRHRAGQFFTIRATAIGAGGAPATAYDRTPQFQNVQRIAPAATAGNFTINTWSTSAGVARTDTAKYFEVGGFTVEFKDTTYADVDADDTPPAARQIGPASVSIGRFAPDRFRVTEASLDPGCGAAFTYLGQSFGFPAAAITLTAVSASDTPTLNYTGVFYSLPADTGVQATFAIHDPDPADTYVPMLTVPAGVHPINNQNNGIADISLPALTLVRSATRVAPYDAEIGIELPVITDGDGIATAESPIVLGTATAGGGTPFTGGAKQMRYGRLQLQSAFGSDQLPLDVPLRAEYFDGVTFIPSSTDACTTLLTADITTANLAAGQTRTLNATGPGSWLVSLTAPGDTRTVDLSIDLSAVGTPPYLFLLTDTNGDAAFDDDPSAAATFGRYRSDDRRIYQREVIR